jgi:hypothetical protein
VSLKQGARHKVDAINQGSEGRIIDADKQLLNDNAQFAASMEVMRWQLEFVESQNSLLRTSDTPGKGAFDEFTRGATGQLEMPTRSLRGSRSGCARKNSARK